MLDLKTMWVRLENREIYMLHFVYGAQERIFLNTALGCSARCQYCYLPELDIGNRPEYISAEETLEMLRNLSYFVPGPLGTILSIGCYSECWDKHIVLKPLSCWSGSLPWATISSLPPNRRFVRKTCSAWTKLHSSRARLACT